MQPDHAIYQRLQLLADAAERRYYATCRARTGHTCWELTSAEQAIPEIRDAYRAKVNADEALLTYLRLTR